MTDMDKRSQEIIDMRRRAEVLAMENGAWSPERLNALSPEEIRCLLHELRVHQIELEMQNEELRQTQEKLDAARVRYFDLYDLAPVSYCTVSEKGEILEANLTAATLLEVPRGSLVHQPFNRFIFDEDQNIYYRHRKRLLETGEPQTCELRVLRRDQSPFWTHLEATAAREEDGTSVCRVVITDISDCKRAEEALRESETRFRMLYEKAPLGYQSLNEKGCFIEVNQTWLDTLGYSREEVIGKSFAEFLHPDWKDHFKEKFPRFKALGEVLGVEFEMVKKDGSCILVSFNGKIGKDSQGNFQQTHCILHDITERKHAEAEKEKLNAQLMEARKMESIGRLAGGIAHDFNNMLSVILGYTELILAEIQPDQPLYAELEEIQKSGLRSADLVRQLLVFARKQPILPTVLNLNEVVEEMLKMLRRLIGENVTLTWLPGKNLWPVKMDSSQIDQILANLCVNARDAITNIGNVAIETKNTTLMESHIVNEEAIPGEYVRIEVRDDGHGMNKETQEKLFEPFFTTKEVGKGVGLGLATVYGIVKQNNGFIHVQSEVGHGTTFHIYLPRHQGKAKQASKEVPAKPAARGHETILLVEDEPAIMGMVSMMLQRHGYTVVAANTPGEAMRLAEAHPGEIHLLMSDVVMPDMNGHDLAKRLSLSRPKLRRLFMSGYTADIISDHGVLDEGLHFIQKPFSINEMTDKVREVLDSD